MSTLDVETSPAAGTTSVDPDVAPSTLDPARPYRLHPQVALRPEPFGALAYHYGNRRLVFLKQTALVALVRSIADHPSVDGALDDAIASGMLTVGQRRSYQKALASLVASDILCPREEP